MAADHKLRIIMLGETRVGKTSLMLRFCKNIFRDEHKITLIVDSYSKTIFLNDIKIELELWDTVGQERFKSIVKEYFRKADGVLLAYDITNIASFMKLSGWLSELRELNEEATVLIVGNKNDLLKEDKADLQQQKHVSRSTVEKYARDEGLDFCETSAKNNENVDEVFKNLALKILERKKIAPFFDEMTNGEIKAERSSPTDSDSNEQQTEFSLPPIIRLGDDSQVIKLTIEKPKEKKKKSCC